MRKATQNQFFGLDKEKAALFIPGAVFVATDSKKIYVYDRDGRPRLASGTSTGGGGAQIIVDTYNDLPIGEDQDTIAFVLYSQGTAWLPGGLGGTYYPAGWYIYRGATWISIEIPIDDALADYNERINDNTTSINNHKADLNNPHQVDKTDVGLSNVDNTSDLDKPLSNASINALSGKSNVGHNHLKVDITDFVETDYATGAEGDLATTALQPGDNISQLVNDEVYLQPSDNISALTNDAGYIIGNTVTSYRSDVEVDVHYSGYILNSVITIKKCDAGVETFAIGLTNLETDWTNRLSLTYL